MSIDPSQLTSRRVPRLVARVMARWANYQHDLGPQVEERNTTQSGVVMDAATSKVSGQFNLGDNRWDVYWDCEDMDRLSEEFSVALDTIANNVVSSEDGAQESFQVIAENPEDQAVIDDANAKLGMHRAIKSIVRNLVKYGDSFTEPVVNKVDADLQLVAVKQLPPKTIWRNQDPKGNLLMGRPRYANGKCENEPGECAFDQRDSEEEQKVVAAFFPWQLIHARLNWDGFSPYGQALGRVSRNTWKQLRALQEAMVVARLTRAYLKLVYYIDTSGLGPAEKRKAVSAYKEAVQTKGRLDNRRDAQMQVLTDFFVTTGTVNFNGTPVPQLSKIDTIDPQNGDLHQIDDVIFLQKKLISTTHVPPAHLGFEKEINAKATLTQQDVQYVRFLRGLQQDAGTQVLEPIYNLAFILAGKDPTKVTYRITWPALKAADELSAAQALFARAQAVGIFLGASQMNMTPVVTPEWVMANILQMPPDEIEEELAKLQEQHDQQQQEQADQADQANQHQMAMAKTQGKTQVKTAKAAGSVQPKGKPAAPAGAPGKKPVQQDLPPVPYDPIAGHPVVTLHRGEVTHNHNHKVAGPVTIVHSPGPPTGEPDQPRPQTQRDEGQPE